MAGDKQFPSFLASSFYLCLTLILKSDHSLERQSAVHCSLCGGVGGSGAASCHGVDGGTRVLGHIVIGSGADHICGGLPDENGALRASRHNELLVRGDRDL